MKKINSVTDFLLVLAFVFIGNLSSYAHAFKNFKYPKTAFGIGAYGGHSTVQELNPNDAYNGLNFGLRALWEFNDVKSQNIGFVTGLGIDYIKNDEHQFFQNYTKHNITAIHIPMLLHMRAGKVFVIEAGGDVNVIVQNYRERIVQYRQTIPVDLVAYGGFRINFYPGVSLGLGLRWGLTPFEVRDVPWLSDKTTYLHRSAIVSFNYMFYKQ